MNKYHNLIQVVINNLTQTQRSSVIQILRSCSLIQFYIQTNLAFLPYNHYM